MSEEKGRLFLALFGWWRGHMLVVVGLVYYFQENYYALQLMLVSDWDLCLNVCVKNITMD